MIPLRKFKLDRRTMLRGAGSIAIALPWLEAMGVHDNEAHAQTAGPAKRFLSVYTPGGTVLDKFWPSMATDPSSSSILAPLAPLASKLAVLEGLDYACKDGEQHQAGIIAFLTGSKQNGSPGNYSSYPSIDQVIATKTKADKKIGSLQIAVRWATGRSKGQLHPINSVNFEDSPALSPISPLLNPVAIFNDLFGSLDPSSAGMVDARIARRKSVLDFVDKRYAALSSRLGAADKARVDDHLSKIRDIELGLDKTVMMGGVCKAPTMIDTSKYDYAAGLNMTTGVDTVQASAVETDQMIPDVGKLMMDMMVMSFACDLTAVGSFQWSDTEAKHTFPWLNLSEHHHFYQHDGGFQAADCEKIGIWYSQMHLYLLSAMDKIDMGGHTLLDESVVFFGSELAHPPEHTNKSIPLMLAGAGGGLKGGRHLKYGGRPHNDLLVSILDLFGETRTSYGHPEFNTGPITDLRG